MAYQFGDITKGLYSGLKNIWNDITGYSTEVQNTNAVNQTNKEIAEETNKQNYDVAMQNLGFQRDLQEYNKALQQKMFEREDTSYQRTAKDMIAAGLNPLSMQGTNGAGEAIALSPLQNNYNAQQSAAAQKAVKPVMTAENVVSSVNSVMSQINEIKTANLERDRLRTEIDKQKLENAVYAKQFGILKDVNGKYQSANPYGQTSAQKLREQYERDSAYYQSLTDKREYEHKVDSNIYATDLKEERILTALEDWVLNGRGSKALEQLKKRYPLVDMLSGYVDYFLTGKYPAGWEDKYTKTEVHY